MLTIVHNDTNPRTVEMARSSEQVNRIKPELKRSAGVFKRSSDCRVNVMAAPLAGISAFRLDSIPLSLALAFRTSMALAKAHIEKEIQARFVGVECPKELPYRDAGFFVLLAHA